MDAAVDTGSAPASDKLDQDRRSELDALVERSRLAAAAYSQYTQAEVDAIVHTMVLRGLDAAQELAIQAVAETRLGILEDKAIKNMVATEFVYHSIKNERTVGVIREHRGRGLKEVAEPIGVILGVTPITNPTSTVLFKSLMVAKTRNTILFCPHPSAVQCSSAAARLMAEAALAAGAPPDTILWVDGITHADIRYLMRHPDVALIDATGGPGMVKAAYSSGKPALGVGAGNVPCYLHRSADLDMAVVDILTSKTFDNGTICASEQTVLIDRPLFERALELFARYGAHVCSEEEVALLRRTVVDPTAGRMQPQAVGQSAVRIAAGIGLEVAPETKLLVAPLPRVGRDEPLCCEKLFPVLGVFPVDSVDEAINGAMDVLYFGGVGHTASIFATDDEVIGRFADALNAGRIIVNSPSSVGALGGVYNDLAPTFSFGCGTGGGNSTIENVTVRNYLNIKQVAERTPLHQWFRAPSRVHFNLHALENLRDIPSRNVLLITSQDLDELGFKDMIHNLLPANVLFHAFNQVEVEPSFETVFAGVHAIQHHRPDLLIAVGGGSVMDAAKAMRLFYTCPDLDYRCLETTFLDPRKRVVQYPPPTLGPLRLVAIPTTSGTGSEVTPFAVITDSARGRKVPLYDASLTPDVAIIDPQLLVGLPATVTADTGLDALTHAIEALVSIFASEYTDALAYQSARLIFEYLPHACRNGQDIEARARMANAATMAGLAFANAFVGVNHALAHGLGAEFALPHGRANAVLLPYVIRYNASVPTKFMPFPNVRAYIADRKYADLVDTLGWGGTSVASKVEILVERVVQLLEACRLPSSIRDAGIDRDAFAKAMPLIVRAAYDDISIRSNPRMPLIQELERLLWTAYEGNAE